MRKLLFVILLMSQWAFGTTPVTGVLKNIDGSLPKSSFVRLRLAGCSTAQPRVNGVALFPPGNGSGSYYVDFPPDASGNLSGTVYSTRDAAGTGDGEIDCAGSKQAVSYAVAVWHNGSPGPELFVHAKNGVSLDLTNFTPITSPTVVTAPTGDTTYCRTDGGNCGFTGPVSSTSSISQNWLGTSTGDTIGGTVSSSVRGIFVGSASNFISTNSATSIPIYHVLWSNQAPSTAGYQGGTERIDLITGTGQVASMNALTIENVAQGTNTGGLADIVKTIQVGMTSNCSAIGVTADVSCEGINAIATTQSTVARPTRVIGLESDVVIPRNSDIDGSTTGPYSVGLMAHNNSSGSIKGTYGVAVDEGGGAGWIMSGIFSNGSSVGVAVTRGGNYTPDTAFYSGAAATYSFAATCEGLYDGSLNSPQRSGCDGNHNPAGAAFYAGQTATVGSANSNKLRFAATNSGTKVLDDIFLGADQTLHIQVSGADKLLLTSGGVLQSAAQVTPMSAGGTDLGASSLPWNALYIGAAATNNIKVTGTATAGRQATLPDNTGIIAELNFAQAWSALQTFSSGFSATTGLFTAAAPTTSAGQFGLGNGTATTASAGANGATPAQVAGYWIVNNGGTTVKIPFYAN